MNAANTYATGLAENLTKITMIEFLEMTEHEDEFVIHHSKLVEYGIMTSTDSSKVRIKLNSLGMEEGKDYRLAHVSVPVEQGGFVKSKVYYLTPAAFKQISFAYTTNPHMSYDDVIQIINDVHNITQKTPVP